MKNKRQPLTASLLTLSTFVVTATAVPYSVSAAEMCYQDDVGRIVKRRRPGYVEVPCPDPIAPAGQSRYRKEIQVRITSAGSWDPANDWSYAGLPTNGAEPATTANIVLTDATGTVLWGSVPS